jgi:hypothetical protein
MPNACNLCHLDKSLAWTRDALEEQWGKRIELPRSLESLYGKGFARSAGEAWLNHPFYAARVVAAGAYARSPLGEEVLPRLLRRLEDPNAYMRLRFLQSVESILGRTLGEAEYSLTGPPDLRKEQVQHLLEPMP